MIKLRTVIFLLLLTSCGSDKDLTLDEQNAPPLLSCPTPDERLTMEVIIDDLDWIDYRELKNSRKIRNSKTTGQIKIPTINASCTAFLVNDTTIMTNNHCVPNQNYAYGVRLLLRDEAGLKETYYCERLLATDARLDFSLVECDGRPGEKYGHIPLSMGPPSKDQDMYVVQENCDYMNQPRCRVQKYVAQGKIQKVSLSSISHNADTLGGSSGSPIFHQETHELIGIHHAGMKESDSKPAMNFGIPMYRIAKYLYENHPDIKITRSMDAGGIDDQEDDTNNLCN